MALVNFSGPNGGSSTAPATAALTWTPTIGNYLFLMTHTTFDGSGLVTAVADTYGNTYTKVSDIVGPAGIYDALWWAPVTVTGINNILTAMLSVTSKWKTEAWEFNALTGVVDRSATRTSAQTTTDTITAAGANTGTNDLVITACNIGVGTPPSGLSNPPSGYTTLNWIDYNGGGGFTNQSTVTGYRIDSGTGATDSATFSWTAKGAFNTCLTLASFKGTATAGGGIGTGGMVNSGKWVWSKRR